MYQRITIKERKLLRVQSSGKTKTAHGLFTDASWVLRKYIS